MPKHHPGILAKFIRSKSAQEESADYFERRRNASISPDATEAEIRDLVRKLRLSREKQDFAKEKLRLLGTRALPALLEALRRPSFLTKRKKSDWSRSDTPLESVLDLLEPFGPREAVKPLTALIRSPDEFFRKTAALALGNIASDDCVEPVRCALHDDDDHVRCYAMMGIQRGISANRVTERFRLAVFDALVTLLDRDDDSLSQAPKTLLALDQPNALPIMLSERFLHARNPIVPEILDALCAAKVSLPPNKILDLMISVEGKLESYPNDRVYGLCLRLLARTDNAEKEEIIRTAAEHPNHRISEAAAEALSIVHGIDDAVEIAFGREQHEGFDMIPEPLKVVVSVRLLKDQVDNGGFQQFFFNSSGDRSLDALQGLKAIGSHNVADVLQRAIQLFGSRGPSPSRGERVKQMKRISEPSFSKLDETFFERSKEVNKKLLIYIVENKASFAASTSH